MKSQLVLKNWEPSELDGSTVSGWKARPFRVFDRTIETIKNSLAFYAGPVSSSRGDGFRWLVSIRYYLTNRVHIRWLQNSAKSCSSRFHQSRESQTRFMQQEMKQTWDFNLERGKPLRWLVGWRHRDHVGDADSWWCRQLLFFVSWKKWKISSNSFFAPIDRDIHHLRPVTIFITWISC